MRLLTQHSQVEFSSEWSWRQQILGLAHQIGSIVLGGGGELVHVLRQAARGALRRTDSHAVPVPSQLGWGIPATAATGYLHILAAVQALALAIALKERRSRRICGGGGRVNY